MKSSDFRTCLGFWCSTEKPQIFGPMTWVCFPGHVYVVRCSTLRHVKEEQLYRQILDGKYEFDVGKPSKKTVKVCPTIIILKWILVVDEKWWETREKNLVKVAPSGVGEGCLLGPESYEQWWEWFASINVHKTRLQHVVTSFLDGLQDECFEGFGYMFPWTMWICSDQDRVYHGLPPNPMVYNLNFPIQIYIYNIYIIYI